MHRFIELEGIDAGYGPRTVIHGLHARFPRHRVTALLGPGGSGKSTLLRVLEGAKDDPWSLGYVPSIDGWRLPQRSRDGTAKPEADSWDDAVAVLARWLRGRGRLLSPSMWTALLSCPTVLTRLASVLKARAEVLLLDEPDVPAEGAVHAALATVIRRLRTDGHTIILVTHNLDFARNIADHLLLLVDGEKLDEGSLSRVQREPASARVLEFLTWGG